MRLLECSSKLEKCSAVGCCKGTAPVSRGIFRQQKRAHLVAESRQGLKERVKRCPRRSSNASRRPASFPGGLHDQLARLDSVAPGASRFEYARSRHGAGTLYSRDPLWQVFHPLTGPLNCETPPSAVPPRPQRFAPTVAPPSSTALLMLADQALSCACRYLERRVLPSSGVPWQAGK
jgi:hypothetical protein